MTDSDIKKLAKEYVRQYTEEHPSEDLDFTPKERFAISVGLLLGIGATILIEKSSTRRRLNELERKVYANETI